MRCFETAAAATHNSPGEVADSAETEHPQGPNHEDEVEQEAAWQEKGSSKVLPQAKICKAMTICAWRQPSCVLHRPPIDSRRCSYHDFQRKQHKDNWKHSVHNFIEFAWMSFGGKRNLRNSVDTYGEEAFEAC